MSERRMFITPDGTVRILEKKPGSATMTDPNRDRPSWLPSDEEIRNAYCDDIEEDGWPHMLRLFEIAVLKGQIEAHRRHSCSCDFADGEPDVVCTRCSETDRLRARLSELEGSHE